MKLLVTICISLLVGGLTFAGMVRKFRENCVP